MKPYPKERMELFKRGQKSVNLPTVAAMTRVNICRIKPYKKNNKEANVFNKNER